jgi:hypothetical protein
VAQSEWRERRSEAVRLGLRWRAGGLTVCITLGSVFLPSREGVHSGFQFWNIGPLFALHPRPTVVNPYPEPGSDSCCRPAAVTMGGGGGIHAVGWRGGGGDKAWNCRPGQSVEILVHSPSAREA